MSSFFKKASAPLANENETENSDDVNSEKNFWNIKGYKSALKRCDDGFKSGEKFKECINDLAELEDSYAKSLKKWEKKWLIYLSTESTEYQSGKDTWVSFLKVGSEVSDLHSELSDKLQRTAIDSVKKWLEENYKKSFLHFKKTKEFEKQFQDAQKAWQVSIDKVKGAKDDFFLSDKKLREAETGLKLKYSGAECNTVMKREAERKADLAKIDREKMEKRYKDEIDLLGLSEPRYKNDMQKVFDETQMFEETRLKFFKQIYTSCLEILVQQSKGPGIENIFMDLSGKIDSFNHENDLNWWSSNHGTGMQLLLPKFEVPL
jgi:hypothetical protein